MAAARSRGVRLGRPAAVLPAWAARAGELRDQGVDLPERVRALGWREHPADYLNAADLVAISSWTEGYSNVAAEALWLGRPVVTTDTGAHPALVRDCGGRVVPIRRPDLLGAAIVDLLGDPPAPEEVAATARAALGVDALVDATLAIYERAGVAAASGAAT